MTGQPTTREILLDMLSRNGFGPARRYAMWMGRPRAEVRAELEHMEAEGIVERWHERPGLEWRWGLRDA